MPNAFSMNSRPSSWCSIILAGRRPPCVTAPRGASIATYAAYAVDVGHIKEHCGHERLGAGRAVELQPAYYLCGPPQVWQQYQKDARVQSSVAHIVRRHGQPADGGWRALDVARVHVAAAPDRRVDGLPRAARKLSEAPGQCARARHISCNGEKGCACQRVLLVSPQPSLRGKLEKLTFSCTHRYHVKQEGMSRKVRGRMNTHAMSPHMTQDEAVG